MKKYLLMLAAFVAATATFTACSSEEDLSASSGQEERGVVKTEFTISIPQKASGITRMSTAAVQGQMDGEAQAPVFLGIQGIFLYPLREDATTLKTTEGASAMTLPTSITLFKGTATDGWYGPSSSDNDNSIGATSLKSGSSSHLYKDVEIPIGTESMIFYGEALRSTTSTNFENGAIKNNLSTSGLKLNQIRFEPQGIVSTNAPTNNGTYIANYMTQIAKAEGWRTSTNVVLSTLYERFTSIRTGSWRNVKAAVQELYSSIYSRTTEGKGATDVIYAEADAVAYAILNTTIGTTETKFVTSHTGSTLTFVEDATLGNYPADMKLPDGAAQISWNKDDSEPANWKFEVLTATGNTGLEVAALVNYAYPAPLYYRVLSDIRVSEESKYSAYNTASNWDAVLNSYEKDDDNNFYRSVTSKTRSIAVDDKIQYAVGRLDVTVQAGSFSLKDFSGADVSVSGTNFKLTGVFVDGQKEVDYQFNSVGTTNFTVYDKEINGDIYLTSETPTQKNHTLLFETGLNEEVHIALEFENNTGKKIIGKNNAIIYPGCKFYLKGTLSPTEKSIKKVFQQDYITLAKLTINSFENAYNILPDLRSPELELGVSVDLSWQTGETYEISIE